MVKFYTNNKYIQKWCEKVTGTKTTGYRKNNYYLRKICEAVTGQKFDTFHTDNYYLRLICENWHGGSTDVISFPTINTITCYNDPLFPAKVKVEMDSKYDGVEVDLYVNGEKIMSKPIVNGVLEMDVENDKLVVDENICYLKVNSAKYTGQSNDFSIFCTVYF